jgi:hypothetical protein
MPASSTLRRKVQWLLSKTPFVFAIDSVSACVSGMRSRILFGHAKEILLHAVLSRLTANGLYASSRTREISIHKRSNAWIAA